MPSREVRFESAGVPCRADDRVASSPIFVLLLLIILGTTSNHSAFGFTIVLKSGERIEGTWLGEKESLVFFRDDNNRTYAFPRREIDFTATAKVFQAEQGKNLSPPGVRENNELSRMPIQDSENSLNAIEIRPAGAGKIDVILAGTGDLLFDAFELQDPPRIVIDLHAVHLNYPKKSIANNNTQDLFVRIRTSQYDEDTARVVIDLKNAIPFQILKERGALHVRLNEKPTNDVDVIAAKAAAEELQEGAVDPEIVTDSPVDLQAGAKNSDYSLSQGNNSESNATGFEASVSRTTDDSRSYESVSRSDAFFQSLFEFESNALDPFVDSVPGNLPEGSIRASYRTRLSRAFRVETEGEISRRVNRDGTESESEFYLKPQLKYRMNRHNELSFYSIYRTREYDFEADHIEYTRSLGMAYTRKLGRDRFQVGYRYDTNESTWDEDEYVRWVYNAGYTKSWSRSAWTKVEVNYAPQEFANRFVRGPTRGSKLQRFDRRWIVTLASVIRLSQGLDLIPAYRYESRSSNGRVRDPSGHLPSLRLRYTW